MKKKMLVLSASLLAIAAVATTVVATNSNNEMSLLAMNVEALARSESGWFAGYKTGEITINQQTVSCCVPSVETDGCDFDELGCIKVN